MAPPPDIAAVPTWEELRSRLIPKGPQDRWDAGELPRAILHLDDHAVLEGCELLSRLACVQRRSLESARPSRAVALREVLLELLPQTLDHPYCAVLRVLAGREPGSAGRSRDERQRLAGDRLGPPRHPATPRTVRRRVKVDCWPWLHDRLIELETEHRRACDASAATPRSATTPQLSAALDADQQRHVDATLANAHRYIEGSGASSTTLGVGVDWDRLDHAARMTCLDAATAEEYAALDVQSWRIFATSVAGNAEVVTELAASVAGNDPGPLATVQTTHHVDIAVAALADHRAITYLRRWLDDGHDSVLRVNAAGILAKLPGQGEASRVADALSRDREVRDRYMTAVVARVCGVDWPTASALIREPSMFASMFPRAALVAGRFAHEAVSPDLAATSSGPDGRGR